ncbi:methyltransferase B [Melanomma pulvis-pyrius CBS 109.77]|uniref:Methyltransferase B n=1 Tax=Melanomma pulvis-pyrius CBS 109.77 TaxID=1314802 RepID=A0A6A6XHJ2_9PLEO|nr:methyltransferase B [Melanomma pulvis-pyrius CBS 109.77]
MDAIADQVRGLYAKGSEDERRQLQVDLRELQTSLDTEWDMVVRLGSGFFQMALVKIGVDLKIFDMLVASSTPLSLENIREKTGAAPGLLGHILRALAAFGLIKETAQDTFTSSRLTQTLANSNVSGAVDHVFDIHAVVAHTLPSYLKSHAYQDMTSNLDLPFHQAFKTTLTPFDWLRQRPEQMKSLGHAMAMQREEHWIEHYPVLSEIHSFIPSPTSALLVDVGGGFGQQAIAFHQKFADAPGRIIVQDIPETLDRAKPVEGIEFQVQDFFKPQQVKGAKFYYLRHILHDWTDADCVRILSSIVPAMGPESRLVIDEIVLPNVNVPWQAAYMDLTMMASLGGIERTRKEYESLLEKVGLRIVDLKTYDAKMQAVILAALK